MITQQISLYDNISVLTIIGSIAIESLISSVVEIFIIYPETFGITDHTCPFAGCHDNLHYHV